MSAVIDCFWLKCNVKIWYASLQLTIWKDNRILTAFICQFQVGTNCDVNKSFWQLQNLFIKDPFILVIRLLIKFLLYYCWDNCCINTLKVLWRLSRKTSCTAPCIISGTRTKYVTLDNSLLNCPWVDCVNGIFIYTKWLYKASLPMKEKCVSLTWTKRIVSLLLCWHLF